MTEEEKRSELRKRGSMLVVVGILMCVLIVVVLMVLMCSLVVNSTYGDVTGVVIDRSHAVIAAAVAAIVGIVAFLFRHYTAR